MSRFTHSEASQLGREIAAVINEMNKGPQSGTCPFSEARLELNIKDDALTNRIKKLGVPTYQWGKGKAFDRKYLHNLKYMIPVA